MSIRSIALATSAAAGLLAAFPASAACSLQTQPIPLKMDGGRPMVEVKVDGKTGHFLINSTAVVNQIGAKFAASQKLEPTKTANSEIVTVPKFELGGFAIPNASFIATDKLPEGADGVIGQTFLHLMDAEYDLAGGKILLAKAVGCETSNMAHWANDGDMFWEIPLAAPSNGLPLTEATILVNGVKMTALFDTGVITTRITKAAAEKAGVKTSDATVKPLRGSEGHWIGNFTVNVGGEELKNSPLEITQSNDTYYDVLIGADYFTTHHLYVANSQQKIYATRAGFPGAPVFQAHQPTSLGMDSSDAARGRLGPGNAFDN